jgi:hypothetical protein
MDGLKGPPHVWHPCQSYVVPTHKKKKKQVKDVDKKTLVQKTYNMFQSSLIINTSAQLSINCYTFFCLFSFHICLSIYNSIRLGPRPSCVACKINRQLIVITNNNYHFKKNT